MQHRTRSHPPDHRQQMARFEVRHVPKSSQTDTWKMLHGARHTATGLRAADSMFKVHVPKPDGHVEDTASETRCAALVAPNARFMVTSMACIRRRSTSGRTSGRTGLQMCKRKGEREIARARERARWKETEREIERERETERKQKITWVVAMIVIRGCGYVASRSTPWHGLRRRCSLNALETTGAVAVLIAIALARGALLA